MESSFEKAHVCQYWLVLNFLLRLSGLWFESGTELMPTSLDLQGKELSLVPNRSVGDDPEGTLIVT